MFHPLQVTIPERKDPEKGKTRFHIGWRRRWGRVWRRRVRSVRERCSFPYGKECYFWQTDGWINQRTNKLTNERRKGCSIDKGIGRTDRLEPSERTTARTTERINYVWPNDRAIYERYEAFSPSMLNYFGHAQNYLLIKGYLKIVIMVNHKGTKIFKNWEE